MKKLVCGILAAVMMMTLCACGASAPAQQQTVPVRSQLIKIDVAR